MWDERILFHSSILHFFTLLVILLTLAGRRNGEGYLYHSRSFQTAGDGIIEGIHVMGKET